MSEAARMRQQRLRKGFKVRPEVDYQPTSMNLHVENSRAMLLVENQQPGRHSFASYRL
jgi:hypothetical protein